MKSIHCIPFLIITFTFGTAQSFGQEPKHFLEIRVHHIPDLVMIAGQPTVYYEVHVTNVAIDSLNLKSIEIFNTVDSSIVFKVNDDELKKRCSPVGKAQSREANFLSPGASSVVYIEHALQKDKQNVQLAHRIHFEPIRSGKLDRAQGGTINLSKKPPLILGQPLSTGIWTAIYDPSWPRGHRRAIYTVNGKNYIPGRFAIDFIRLNDQGKYSDDDENIVKNWYGYGNDVLAVADGVVASMRDDFPESTTLSEHPGYPSDKATGNYVSIDIGNNLLAFYEHLKPGSVKVKQGQRVRKGDVIASLGFTGQSTGPHLHFHVANLNSPLGAEGIPFVFERFAHLGSYTDFGKFGKEPWTPVKNSIIRNERPAPNSVIRFLN